jgi:hypothetical protein
MGDGDGRTTPTRGEADPCLQRGNSHPSPPGPGLQEQPMLHQFLFLRNWVGWPESAHNTGCSINEAKILC